MSDNIHIQFKKPAAALTEPLRARKPSHSPRANEDDEFKDFSIEDRGYKIFAALMTKLSGIEVFFDEEDLTIRVASKERHGLDTSVARRALNQLHAVNQAKRYTR